MANYEKVIATESVKRDLVLKILELLNGESFNDSKEVLEIAMYFLKENAYLDYDLAKEMINNLEGGV